MAADYFAILGLTPGRYEPAEIARRFRATQKRLLAELDDPAHHADACRQLDHLHIAYATLHEPQLQREYLNTFTGPDDVAQLRALIEASLEGGLLRHSRRQEILDAGQACGLSGFQTHLLIAEVQFGESDVLDLRSRRRSRPPTAPARAGLRVAGAGVLALALFLWMMHWLAG